MYSDKVVPAIKSFLRKPLVIFTFVLYVVVSAISVVSGFIGTGGENPDITVDACVTILVTGSMIIAYCFSASKNNVSIETGVLSTLKRLLILRVVGTVLLVAMSGFSVVGEPEYIFLPFLMIAFGAVYVFATVKGIEFLDSIICAIDYSYPDTSAPRIVGVLQFVLAPLSLVSVFIGRIGVLSVITALLGVIFHVCFGFVLLQYLDYMKNLRLEIMEEDLQKTQTK